MTTDAGKHGAYVSADDMLTSIQGLTVAVAENNVRLGAVLEDNREMKKLQEKQREELGALKLKVYTMAAGLSLVTSIATSWVKGDFGLQ